MKRIAMIGTPIDHVETPRLLNPIFHAAGDLLTVVPVEVDLPDLAGFVAAARRDDTLAGLVVTTPLKRAIVPHLARASDLVVLTGSANCVRFDRSGWTGLNLDGHGFQHALLAVTKSGPCDTALIVGCGAAGGAIAARLVAAGDIAVTLYDADAGQSARLCDVLLRMQPQARVHIASAACGAFDLAVNASTAGLAHEDPSPIPETTVQAARWVGDIVTLPDTRLKRLAAKHGRPLVSGKAMVSGQIALMRQFFVSDATSEDVVSRMHTATQTHAGQA